MIDGCEAGRAGGVWPPVGLGGDCGVLKAVGGLAGGRWWWAGAGDRRWGQLRLKGGA